MNKVVYPLKEVLEVKQRRVEEAEKVVKEKQIALEQEQKKLKECEAARDKVKGHKQDKLQQLRDTLDQGSTSPKIQQMKVYLKLVDEKLKVEEKKVKEQQERVDVAEKNLQQAKKDLHVKRQEVEKLTIHRKDWEKEKRRELELIEGREQDELGATIHLSQHHKP